MSSCLPGCLPAGNEAGLGAFNPEGQPLFNMLTNEAACKNILSVGATSSWHDRVRYHFANQEESQNSTDARGQLTEETLLPQDLLDNAAALEQYVPSPTVEVVLQVGLMKESNFSYSSYLY